jgi:hypothetical protein
MSYRGYVTVRKTANHCYTVVYGRIRVVVSLETAEKEVQDTSCRGSGGVPQIFKSPKIGGLGG